MDILKTLIYHKWLEQPLQTPSVHTKAMNRGNAPLFVALYNEAFCQTSSALMMDDEAMDSLLGDENKQIGFFLVGGLPVGVYVVDVEQEPVQLCAIAISPEWRGRGYAKQAFFALEKGLLEQGYSELEIVTSADNGAARGLYKACGCSLL